MTVRFRLGALAVAASLVAVGAWCIDIGDAHPRHPTRAAVAASTGAGHPSAAATTDTAAAADVHRHTFRTARGVVVAMWDTARLASAQVGSVPWIAYVHGGGWVAGSPTQSNAMSFCHAQVERGRTCFSLGYTLAPTAVWPRQQSQVDDEVAWIRSHAGTFHLDPHAGFVIGHSAGGLMAMLAGLHDRGFAGMVSLDGATDVPYTIAHNADRHVGHDASLLVGGAGPDSALARSASVIGNLDGDAPRTPALVIHETDDPIVDRQQSAILARGLAAAGIPVTYDLIPGRSHASDQDPQTVAALDAWIAGRLAEVGAGGATREISGS